MRSSVALLAMALLAVPGLALTAPGTGPALAGTTTATGTATTAAGRDLLARVFAGPRHPVTGTVAVVALDDDGPFVSELEVHAMPDGTLVVGRSHAFAVSRDGDSAFLARDGSLLRLGAVIGDDDPVEVVLRTYDALVENSVELETGHADVVALLDGHGVVRERLFVDDRTGVVARRETYDLGGRARRLVAFTRLAVVDESLAPSAAPAGLGFGLGLGAAEASAQPTTVVELDEEELETLRTRDRAVAPERLGDFELTRAFSLDVAGEASTLHLVYTDGLYSASVYEQAGHMAPTAVDGAVEVVNSWGHVWRWPGAQPERLVWSADGHTFTVVGDASLDHLLASLEPLPGHVPTGLRARLSRGLHRVGSWLDPRS